MADNKLIYSFQKNATEEIRISLSEYKGHNYIDFRVYFKDKDGDIVYKFDAMGALRALELLGKHLGMFKEKIRVETEAGLQAILDVLPIEVRLQVIENLKELCEKENKDRKKEIVISSSLSVASKN